jgi:hypothetical protein
MAAPKLSSLSAIVSMCDAFVTGATSVCRGKTAARCLTAIDDPFRSWTSSLRRSGIVSAMFCRRSANGQNAGRPVVENLFVEEKNDYSFCFEINKAG